MSLSVHNLFELVNTHVSTVVNPTKDTVINSIESMGEKISDGCDIDPDYFDDWMIETQLAIEDADLGDEDHREVSSRFMEVLFSYTAAYTDEDNF